MNDTSAYNGPEYPTEAHGSIPAFNSYEEEANFWDTHSISDFREETEAAKVHATRGLSANVQVRFDPETDHELEAIARERGMKAAWLQPMAASVCIDGAIAVQVCRRSPLAAVPDGSV